MVAAIVSSLMPKAKADKPQSPGDAAQLGTHASIKNSSSHKKMVSSVLHLKKESVGHRMKQTAFKMPSAKAFKGK